LIACILDIAAMINVFVIHAGCRKGHARGQLTPGGCDAEGPFGEWDVRFRAGESGADLAFVVAEEIVHVEIVRYVGWRFVGCVGKGAECG